MEPPATPPPNITFVSMLVRNPADPNPPFKRIAWLAQLLQAKLPLLLYVDAYYQEILGPQDAYPGLQILPTYFAATEIAIHIAGAPQKELPARRTHAKDTEAFMTLMHIKSELLARAVRDGLVKTPFVAFLDASIAKVLREPTRTLTQLATASVSHRLRVPLIPGCRPPADSPHPVEAYCAQILWTFCGGFFLMPTTRTMEWHVTCREALKEVLATGRLTWEVNLWAMVAERRPGTVAWFEADHNDSMLQIPVEYLEGAEVVDSPKN